MGLCAISISKMVGLGKKKSVFFSSDLGTIISDFSIDCQFYKIFRGIGI
jgi:hypothetical protein